MVYLQAYSAFILKVAKMLLKEGVGGIALNSHGNYIAYHGKIMELCFQISVGTLLMSNLWYMLFFFTIQSSGSYAYVGG